MESWVTVVLPGSGYTALGAAIRLPVLALEAAGAMTRVVEYPGADDEPDESWWDDFHRSVGVEVQRVTSGAGRLTFVAKSLGTMALASLREEVVTASSVDAIWLTPLFGEPAVRSGAVAKGWRSLLVAGGGDVYHHAASHEAVRKALGARSLVLEGANHALEVPGDALATVDRLRQLTEAVIAFEQGPA